MIVLFQILFVLFALYAIGNVLRRSREKMLSTNGARFWILFWLAVVVAVLWPNSTQILADRIGIGRGSDLVIYISIALLFFLLFKLHVKIETLNRNVTKVVRDRALKHKDGNSKFEGNSKE